MLANKCNMYCTHSCIYSSNSGPLVGSTHVVLFTRLVFSYTQLSYIMVLKILLGATPKGKYYCFKMERLPAATEHNLYYLVISYILLCRLAPQKNETN